MSLLDKLTTFILPRAHEGGVYNMEPSSADVLDAVMTTVVSLVKTRDAIQDLAQSYASVRTSQDGTKEATCISIYSGLEVYITTHTPPVVESAFSTTTLRQHVRSHIDIAKLSPYFRVLFAADQERYGLLGCIGLRDALELLIHAEGRDRVVAQFTSKQATAGSEFLVIRKDGTVDITQSMVLLFSSGKPTADDIKHRVQALYTQIYGVMSSSCGKEKAKEAFEKTISMVTSIYPSDILPMFLDLLPREFSAAKPFNPQDLGEAVRQRTSELEEAKHQLELKVQETEEHGKQAEEAKRAMINLLEDARELEEQLTRERDRGQAVVSSIGEGLVVIDRNELVTDINPTGERLLGIARKEALGKAWHDLVKLEMYGAAVPLEKRGVFSALQQGTSQNVTIADNAYYIAPNGRKFPVSVVNTALKGRGDAADGVVIVFRDITTEKESKEIIERTVEERTKELQEEKIRLTASISSLPLGCIMTNINEEIIIMNSVAGKLLGQPRYTRYLRDIEKDLAGALSLHEKHEYCRKEKTSVNVDRIELGPYFLRIFVAPILMDTPMRDFIGSVILVENITEAVVLERSKDEFFSIASHELRTPLTAIRGNTSMMEQFYSEKLNEPELKEMVDDIHQSSVRLIGIVNDFLDVGRLEQGRMTFQKTNWKMEELITESVKELEITAKQKNLTIKLEDLPKDLCEVYADRNKMKQVVFNLVGNSIKFTENGGVTISLKKEDNRIGLHVADTGRGMSPKSQTLLFRKFQQAGDSLFTRDTTKGTGLGLYISKLIMEGMGGTIELESSEVGKGSVFHVTIPCAEANPPAA